MRRTAFASLIIALVSLIIGFNGCLFDSESDNTSPIISGFVKTASNSGIAGVVLRFSGQDSTITGSDGFYSRVVPYHWTGVVIPEKSGYTFIPDSTAYSNLENREEQNYIGVTAVETENVYFPIGEGYYYRFGAIAVGVAECTPMVRGRRNDFSAPLAINGNTYYPYHRPVSGLYDSINPFLPDTIYLRSEKNDIKILSMNGDTDYLNFSAPFDQPWYVSLWKDSSVIQLQITRLNEYEIVSDMYSDWYRIFRCSIAGSITWYEIYRKDTGTWDILFPQEEGIGWTALLLHTSRFGTAAIHFFDRELNPGDCNQIRTILYNLGEL